MNAFAKAAELRCAAGPRRSAGRPMSLPCACLRHAAVRALRPLTVAVPARRGAASVTACSPRRRPTGSPVPCRAVAAPGEGVEGSVTREGWAEEGDGVAREQADAAQGSTGSAEAPGSTAAPSPPRSFASLGLLPALVSRLAAQGIREPTDIQMAAAPVLLQGRDAGLRAHTGSGKTLAYLLPLLTGVLSGARLDKPRRGRGEGTADDNDVRVVVVAPSQELAMQIVRVAQGLLPDDWSRAVQQLIGGANIARQVEALRMHRPLVVVGTPGRLAELDRLGRLGLHRVRAVVLDEADQLLADHFRRDMERIMEHAGRKATGGRQTVMVSATLSPASMRRLSRWASPGREEAQLVAASTAPLRPSPAVAAGAPRRAPGTPSWGWEQAEEGWNRDMGVFTEASAGGRFSDDVVGEMPPNVEHRFVVAPAARKVDALRRAIHALDARKALVFMNFGRRLQDTQFKLEARGMRVACLHGEMRKEQRKAVLDGFRDGDTRVLVVSDVAARGLDLPAVDAVFNLELPSNAPHFVHRAGRTGRAGRPGVVVSVVEPRERFVVGKLAKGLQCEMVEAVVEGGELREGREGPRGEGSEGRGGSPVSRRGRGRDEDEGSDGDEGSLDREGREGREGRGRGPSPVSGRGAGERAGGGRYGAGAAGRGRGGRGSAERGSPKWVAGERVMVERGSAERLSVERRSGERGRGAGHGKAPGRPQRSRGE